MANKHDAVKLLKSISPLYELRYVNDGEGTQAVLFCTPDKPWANTGSTDPVIVYYEMHTSKSSFWDDVIDQIEVSTQTENKPSVCVEDNMYYLIKKGVYDQGLFWMGKDLDEGKKIADHAASNDKDNYHDWQLRKYKESCNYSEPINFISSVLYTGIRTIN